MLCLLILSQVQLWCRNCPNFHQEKGRRSQKACARYQLCHWCTGRPSSLRISIFTEKMQPPLHGELQNGEETNGELGRAASQDRAAVFPIATWKAGFVQTAAQLLPGSCWGGLGTAAICSFLSTSSP